MLFLAVLFCLGFLSLLSKVKTLLPFLICLEFLGLLVFLSLIFLFNNHQDSVILLFFLIVTSSESVLGLVLFVLTSRFFSKDYIATLGLVKF